jgi:hypothetical protein
MSRQKKLFDAFAVDAVVGALAAHAAVAAMVATESTLIWGRMS